jgi:hypothetical protein
MDQSLNNAIIERLEKVVDSLQENSIQMGKLLAVHNEKLDKQDRIDSVLFEKVESVHREVNRRADEIKNGCERDIRLIDERLRLMEKKMWTIAGALTVISVMISPIGQRIFQQTLTPSAQTSMIVPGISLVNEPN